MRRLLSGRLYRAAVLIFSFVLVLLEGFATGGAAQASTVLERALRERVDWYERALADATPEDFVKGLYTRDVVLIGSSPGASIGTDQAVAVIRQIMVHRTPVKAEIVHVVALSPTSAMTLLKQMVGEREVKSLFVWRKEGQTWRVACDMYMPGTYSKQ